jgi:hypothetical protein
MKLLLTLMQWLRLGSLPRPSCKQRRRKSSIQENRGSLHSRHLEGSDNQIGVVYQVVEEAEQLAGKSFETRLQNAAQQRAGHIARSSFMP